MKTIAVSEEIHEFLAQRLSPGQSFDALLRIWYGLPALNRRPGKPRKYPKIEIEPKKSAWASILDLAAGEYVLFPWPTTGEGLSADLVERAKLNPGVMALARRAQIQVRTEGKPAGLLVTRLA